MIRRARLSDIENVVRIENAAFKHTSEAVLLRRTIRQMDGFPGCILVYEDKGYIRGMLIGPRHVLSETERSNGSSRLYITSLAVHPQHQGQGIGRSLLQALRKRYPLPALLVVEEIGCPAYKLYFSEGFRVVRKLKGFIDGGHGKVVDGHLMVAP